MSFDTRIGQTPLTILLDLRHPFSYLALSPAIELGRELGVEIDWLPLAVPTLKAPTEPSPDDDRGVNHRRHRAHMIAREIETYAAAQGITIREPYRSGDATAAHLAWLWVREQAPAALPGLLRELFRAYWSLALDPGDPTAVSPFVAAATGDAEAFLAWAGEEGPEVAERIAASLAGEGYGAVPLYLVEDEVFQGRQHLPMIRWILGGRSGPGPI